MCPEHLWERPVVAVNWHSLPIVGVTLPRRRNFEPWLTFDEPFPAALQNLTVSEKRLRRAENAAVIFLPFNDVRNTTVS